MSLHHCRSDSSQGLVASVTPGSEQHHVQPQGSGLGVRSGSLSHTGFSLRVEGDNMFSLRVQGLAVIHG